MNQEELQAALLPYANSNATLKFMMKNKMPLDLDTYLQLEYPEGIDLSLHPELLAEIPSPLLPPHLRPEEC